MKMVSFLKNMKSSSVSNNVPLDDFLSKYAMD